MKIALFRRSRWLLVAAAVLTPAFAQPPAAAQPAPPVYEMRLVRMYQSNPQRFVFVVGGAGFASVTDLEAFVSILPEGSTLRWAPGCKRTGDEPLLTSKVALGRFADFCKSQGVRFLLVPSG